MIFFNILYVVFIFFIVGRSLDQPLSDKKFRVEFKIENIDWDKNYEDMDNAKTKALKADVENGVS